MSVHFSLLAPLCLTLCDPMDCSMPGFPVHHQLLEFTQTHVHCISDAIQNHACLVYIAPDGMIIFNPKELKNAFVGYADYFVRHTTEYGKNNKRLWETKAVLDLSQGTYVPCNPPIELFEK